MCGLMIEGSVCGGVNDESVVCGAVSVGSD